MSRDGQWIQRRLQPAVVSQNTKRGGGYVISFSSLTISVKFKSLFNSKTTQQAYRIDYGADSDGCRYLYDIYHDILISEYFVCI